MIAIFPEIAAAAKAGDVERLAILVRRYFCDRETFAPRPDVERLMLNAGLAVKSLPMDTLGALLAKDERGAFLITAVVNERVEGDERRFLLAHMLGHYLLEVQPVIAQGDWQASGFREAHCPAKRYAHAADYQTPQVGADAAARKETLADEFAAALLLPRGMVRRAMEQLQNQERAAGFFGVSPGVLKRRLEDIGVQARLPANFLDAERQIGAAPPAFDGKPVAPPADPAMPRAYAASSYGNTERTTRKAPAASPPAAAPPSAPAPKTPSAAPSHKGMDRLREIARKLEKGK